MSISLASTVLGTLVAIGACGPDGTYDGPLVYEQEPEEYRSALSEALRLATSGARFNEALEGLPANVHLPRVGVVPEEHWWVFGSHKRSFVCSKGEASETYFTQYAIISLTFENGRTSGCRVLWRAFFTKSQRPNPLVEPAAPPWSKESSCSDAAS